MKNIFLTLTVIVLTALSCSEDNLNLVNPNERVLDTFYDTEEGLESGVIGIYGIMQSASLMSREYWLVHDLRGDEFESGGGQLEAPFNQILIGTHDQGNAPIRTVWNGLFQVIHRANTIIVQAPLAESVDAEFRNRILGEARAARGWAYFELGTLYGGVPIYEAFATTPDDSNPKSSQEAVLDFARDDLEAAIQLLPLASETSSGRLSQGAALALLGRLHMFRNDYGSAKTVFEQIVNSAQYSLVDEFDDNFQEENEFNSESIWEIPYSETGGFDWSSAGTRAGQERSIRHQMYSAVGWRNLIPSARLLAEFEQEVNGDAKTDPRLSKTIYFTGDLFGDPTSEVPDTLKVEDQRGNTVLFNGEEVKASWRKYSVMYKTKPEGTFLTGINHRVIRYAEILLNLAECELEVGSVNNAIDYLNEIRARASVDMPPYPTARYPVSNADEVFEAIVHEKMVEQAAEQIRNRDILRWRNQGKLTPEPFSYFTANRHELLPIPQTELNNNPEMDQSDQNPGY